MQEDARDRFVGLWTQYFPGADLPIAFYYTDEPGQAERAKSSKEFRCIIGQLAKVRKGTALCFDGGAMGCAGAKRYLGFTQELMPGFEHFLSCGIPGKMEGERYKKSPELVAEQWKTQAPFEAPARYIVFKRWDALTADETPLAVVFFAVPDVLSGLFTLANFDETDPHAVVAPFCAGCASIVYHPCMELQSPRPRAVLGMFDVSARPCVPGDVLTFAVPWPKFTRMVDNMEESFLITRSWDKVRSRMG